MLVQRCAVIIDDGLTLSHHSANAYGVHFVCRCFNGRSSLWDFSSERQGSTPRGGVECDSDGPRGWQDLHCQGQDDPICQEMGIPGTAAADAAAATFADVDDAAADVSDLTL